MTAPSIVSLLALCAAVATLVSCGKSNSGPNAVTAVADTEPSVRDYRPAPPEPAPQRPSRSLPAGQGPRFNVSIDPSRIQMPAVPASAGGPSVMSMPGFGFPAAIGEAREFFVFSESDRREFVRIEAELWASSNPDDQAQLLDELENFYGKELIGVAERIMRTSEDAELRARAVELLAGSTSGDVLNFLFVAASDPAAKVRAGAYYAAGNIRDPRLVDLLEKGFGDQSGEVRWAAMEVAESIPERSRLEAFRRALNSPFTDVALAASDGLEMEGSPRGLEVLFSALDSPNQEVREQAQWSVEWMIDQPFKNASEARSWWAENRRFYDGDLVYSPE